MNTSFDIITVGSSTVDVFVHTMPDQSEILTIHKHVDLCYRLGAKILVKELAFYTGGGGTNTAVAFSRMGLKTGYLGRVGDDVNADVILKNLAEEKVEFLGYKKGISGYSVILDSVSSDRTIFTYKGCNDDLEYSKIHKNSLDTKWFYFSSMMNKSYTTVKKIVSYAKRKGIKIAFNPSLYITKKGAAHLKPILKQCTILVFNKEEAEALLRMNEHHNTTIFEMLEKISTLGPETVIITDGKNGVHCYDSIQKLFYSIKPIKIKIKETTGAGDAFASGFVAAKILGKDNIIALKAGMKNAESVIQYRGAKNILLGPEIFKMAESDKRPVYTIAHKL